MSLSLNGRPDLLLYRETSRLKGLIAERDKVLNDLEEAEAEYIYSFQLTTPLKTRNTSQGPHTGSGRGTATTSYKARRYSVSLLLILLFNSFP